MPTTLIYIHGQYGSPEEAEHFRPLLPGCAGEVSVNCGAIDGSSRKASIGIIANSIGAFYTMCALADRGIAAAYFISPIVDMERIEGVTLDEEHLRYVRQHPIVWRVPTHILYGENDSLTSFATISDFVHRTGASLEVMPGGEHWFHTPEQMAFMDGWLLQYMQ